MLPHLDAARDVPFGTDRRPGSLLHAIRAERCRRQPWTGVAVTIRPGARGANSLCMTKIEAIIPPSKLDELRKALSVQPWISGLTVAEVKGFGRSRGHGALYRGAEYDVDLVPKVKVEVVVPDPLVPRIVHDIEGWLRTGRIGDGKIFVIRIDETIRIRTGERGEEAL